MYRHISQTGFFIEISPKKEKASGNGMLLKNKLKNLIELSLFLVVARICISMVNLVRSIPKL